MIPASILKRHRFTLLLAVTLMGNGFIGSGTQMIPLSIQQLTEQAQVVIRGTVSSKTCLEDDRGRIVTRIRLSVAEVWKGTAIASEFTVIQAGGVLGTRRVTVEGQPNFAVAEEVVVFLALNARGEGVALGVCQGKFEVFQDASGHKQVRNIFHGGAPASGASAQALQNKLGNRRLSLADLKQAVAARSK